jgi:hypothetical protein
MKFQEKKNLELRFKTIVDIKSPEMNFDLVS